MSPPRDDRRLARGALAGGGLLGLRLADPLSGVMEMAARRNGTLSEALPEARALYEKVQATSPVSVLHDYSVADPFFVAKAPGGYGVPAGSSLIAMPLGSTDFGGLAHEVGHATTEQSAIGRLYQNKAGRTAMRGPHALPIAGGLGLLGGLATDDKRLLALAALSGGLLSLPALGSEAMASIRGLRNLQRLGASPEALRSAAKALAPAFGTYLARAGKNTAASALGTGVGMGLRHLMRGDEP